MRESVYDCEGFEWDHGNSDKNWFLHEVTDGECEEIFFNQPLLIATDHKHSQTEQRQYALGRTDTDRWLFIAFTIRYSYIRVISARDMNNRESRKYAEYVRRNANI